MTSFLLRFLRMNQRQSEHQQDMARANNPYFVQISLAEYNALKAQNPNAKLPSFSSYNYARARWPHLTPDQILKKLK